MQQEALSQGQVVFVAFLTGLHICHLHVVGFTCYCWAPGAAPASTGRKVLLCCPDQNLRLVPD